MTITVRNNTVNNFKSIVRSTKRNINILGRISCSCSSNFIVIYSNSKILIISNNSNGAKFISTFNGNTTFNITRSILNSKFTIGRISSNLIFSRKSYFGSFNFSNMTCIITFYCGNNVKRSSMRWFNFRARSIGSSCIIVSNSYSIFINSSSNIAIPINTNIIFTTINIIS
jgi:hypothetical protein